MRDLYSVQGYRYCVLLLALGQIDQVRDRVNYLIDWGESSRGANLLCKALAYLMKAQTKAAALTEPSRAAALLESFDQAVTRLYKANALECVVCGLLARTEFLARFELRGSGTADRAETQELMDQMGMKVAPGTINRPPS